MKKIHIEINFDMIWESGSPETLDYQIEQLLQDQYDLETGSIEINITQDPPVISMFTKDKGILDGNPFGGDTGTDADFHKEAAELEEYDKKLNT